MEQPGQDKLKSKLLANFLSKCRLCLSKSVVKIDIFEDQSLSLPTKIMACVSLEVSSTDQLPKYICGYCRYQLEMLYIFRKRCKNSDAKLRRYISLLNPGKISKFFEDSDDEENYFGSQNFFVHQQQEKQLNTHISHQKQICDSISESEIQTLTGLEEYRNNEPFKIKEEKSDEMEVKYETDDQNRQMQNDHIYSKFLLNEETEDHILIAENNTAENVEHKENDIVVDLDCENEDVNELEVEINTEPLVLNHILKPSSSVEEESVFSLDTDKTNQYIITPSTSKVTETTEPVEKSDFKQDRVRYLEFIDFDYLTNSVKFILAKQIGLNIHQDLKLQILKVQPHKNLAEVEVRTNDETIIVLEVDLDSIIKSKNNQGFSRKILDSQCDPAVSHKNQLGRSGSTHINEKTGFSCKYCNKRFQVKHLLKNHILTHNRKKRFKCYICGKDFMNLHMLNRHNMMHSTDVLPKTL